MIPVEILWLTLIGVFGIIGMARGLWKEIGTSTILLLSLFTLYTIQKQIVTRVTTALASRLPSAAPTGTVEGIYYTVIILFVAFISYQGVVLEFPVKKQKGVIKWGLGFVGGLGNGYLIIGTIWNAAANAGYYGLGNVANTVTSFHQKIVPFLPLSIMGAHAVVPYVFLAVGMILLLAIVLK
jgi:uncharacterized membrane protein required for colicin V production